MSTDIKIGQVWKDRKAPAHVRVDAVTPTRVHYTWADDTTTPGFSVARYVDEFLAGFEPATPAPLDPSKVKAGDTVTVRIALPLPYTLTGQVVGSLGGDLYVGPTYIAENGRWSENATLTAHQPAPEPEPEWKRGTVARLSLLDDDLMPRAYRTGIGTWHAIDDARSWTDADVEGVHEFVVIDPAAVDVDALAAAVHKTWGTAGQPGQMAQLAAVAAIAHLGIEATR